VQIDSPLGSYCIDTTEVTVSQFNEYIVDSGVMIDTPPACDGAVETPLVDDDASDQDLPIGNLGECHAWSYCRWAGKRLCGAIGDGGSVQGVGRPQDTEWVYACINGPLNLAYPYGATYDPQACNTDNEEGGRVPIRSKSGCHGTTPPFDQIYDMVGNVWEFVDDLQGNGSLVNPLGGAWDTTAADLAGNGGGCLYTNGFNGVIFDFPESGFRCCADR
jgi:sulfatase modifying factor 1